MSGSPDELDLFGKIFWFGFIPIAMLLVIGVGGLLAKRGDHKGREQRDALRQAAQAAKSASNSGQSTLNS